jgi:hypothetical protein
MVTVVVEFVTALKAVCTSVAEHEAALITCARAAMGNVRARSKTSFLI